MKNVVMASDNIYLRPLELEDTENCQKWINDPEVSQYLLAGRLPLNRIREEEWIRSHYKTDKDVVFAICLKETDEHIGNCGLHLINWIDRTATLGIMIGEKQRWSRGYGGEAVRLLLKYAFRILNLKRVELSVFDFNERGITCYRKAGFKEEGKLRKRRFRGGRYCDEIIMGILKEEWEE